MDIVHFIPTRDGQVLEETFQGRPISRSGQLRQMVTEINVGLGHVSPSVCSILLKIVRGGLHAVSCKHCVDG